MTLDEAIIHAKEKAEELSIQSYTTDGMSDKEKFECLECAKEHEQLAEWLIELRDLREEAKEWNKLHLICANEGIIVYKQKEH